MRGHDNIQGNAFPAAKQRRSEAKHCDFTEVALYHWSVKPGESRYVDGVVETHSDDLVELQSAHLATVEVGTRPYWVEHYKSGAHRQIIIKAGGI